MSENINLTYYQRNRDVILNRTKDYQENDKERLRGQEINTETYLKKKKIEKRIWKKQISQYVLREENKAKRTSKKLSKGKKNLNIIINKQNSS